MRSGTTASWRTCSRWTAPDLPPSRPFLPAPSQPRVPPCPMIAYVLSLLVVGLIIGAVARLLLPGRDPMGCLATALVGVVGSFVGGLLADVLFGHPGRAAALHPAGLVGSIAGAMVILLLLRLLRPRRW